MRLFISIDLPDHGTRKLTGWLPYLPGFNYTSEEQMHLTLLFLGECNDKQVGVIRSTFNTLSFYSFRIIVQGIDAFPDRKNPRVIWAGVNENDELRHLQEKVEKTLSVFVNSGGNHHFKPHITLARTKKRLSADQLNPVFRCNESITLAIHSISLKKSELSNNGSTHTVLERVYADKKQSE